MPEDF